MGAMAHMQGDSLIMHIFPPNTLKSECDNIMFRLQYNLCLASPHFEHITSLTVNFLFQSQCALSITRFIIIFHRFPFAENLVDSIGKG